MKRKFNLSGILFLIAFAFYLFNIGGILLTVIFNSTSKGWFGGIFPQHFTWEWYRYMAQEHNIGQLLLVTFLVTAVVVLVAMAIAFPTAYVLARFEFKFKGALLSLLLLPMIVPPMAYGIPLASTLYKFRLATKVSGVILANLVPIVPFMILILTPFIEQVGSNLESAAKMLGASRWQTFFRVLVPLAMPGILTAGILSIVKTISMFELTFLVAGAKSQTIIVALYSDAYAAGARPPQAVDALAVVYFLVAITCLAISLRFISPTQMVFKVK